jgi:hypothetical protein
MLQNEQSQRNLGWRSFPSSCRAIRPTSSQRFIDSVDEFFIVQNLVGFLHPRFPTIVDAVF